MNNIKYISAICLSFLLLFAACSDRIIEIIEPGEVAGISLEGVEGNIITVIENDTYTVKVKVNPETAANIGEFSTFNFQSGNTAVFTISESGIIATKGIGEALLTVVAANDPDVQLMCIVKVKAREYLATEIVLFDGLAGGRFMVNSAINISEYLTILPENTTNKTVTYKSLDETVASVNEGGIIKALKGGKVTIAITTADGSEITKNIELQFIDTEAADYEMTFISIDRSAWKITTTHPFVSDTGIGGEPEKLIDNDLNTGLSLNKPGKGGVPAMATIGFTIEAPSEIEFDAFKLVHRVHMSYLAVQGVDILGSNDGVKFTTIQKNVATPYTTDKAVDTERLVPLAFAHKYKFIRVEYSSLLTELGSTAQILEFELGKGDVK